MLTKTIDTRVLLVDDHLINAELVKSMLEDEAGIVLEYQQDPSRALETAAAFVPSVIMVDLHMPMIDGLEVIKTLKQDPRVAQVPIIMLSSNSSPQVKASGFEAGAIDYLVKWPDKVELTARLQAHSRAYRAMQERDRVADALRTSQAALFERTRELASAQASLHEVEKMEAIGQLTSGVAHDFNNVLQLINGHLQLLRVAHRADERTVKRLDAASEGVRRGAQLASQMLAFARRQPLAPVAFNVAKHLRSMEATIRQTLGPHALCLTMDEKLNACIDPAQFEKTMLHLVQNATEAMSLDGWLDIAVDAAQLPGGDSAEAPGYLRVRVADNGAGMPEEVQRRAFEPFFSTKAGNRGAGLGLSLAFGFVKQSGGQIELASVPGSGTTVTMYFPLLRTAAAEELAPTLAPNPVRTVLVVEDEAPVRQVSVEVLRKLGLCVLEAGDGETALDMIRQGLPIDLVFTDIVMPGQVTGRDLARAAAEHLPRAKVLFASGFPAGMDEECEQVQRTQLLRKPYRLDEMARVVQELLA
ncbi:response regulator [Massilia sp. 9I]|uniref:response regulator n=1 Tax=Massilia sp. 9I TaxID=2653152 RepID=UPI0012EF9784|nr:response regulator [Massilia sp. 9I]VXB13695.1 Putative blue-light-activated protein [Massilia sp. 9I]